MNVDNQHILPKYEIAAQERNYPRHIPENAAQPPCTCQVNYPHPSFTPNQADMDEEEVEEVDCVVGKIPAMPMWCAITLLIVNCLFPGLGTVMSAFTVGCCNSRTKGAGKVVKSFCVNFYIGWLQMITVFFFLFGWVWAIYWGVHFVRLAAKRNSKLISVYAPSQTVNVPHSHSNPGYNVP